MLLRADRESSSHRVEIATGPDNKPRLLKLAEAVAQGSPSANRVAVVVTSDYVGETSSNYRPDEEE